MTRFDPARYRFVRLRDFDFGCKIAVYELANHAAVAGEADVLRLNITMSRDGDYTSIWSGLLEPTFVGGLLENPALKDFDFQHTSNEQLFRGYIATDAEAAVILRALRIEHLSASFPQVLEGAPHDLRCEMLPR